MKETVTKVIDTLTQEDFHGAFQKLLERYNKCIAAGGDYFKGDLSFLCVLSIKVPIRKKSGNLFNEPCILCLIVVGLLDLHTRGQSDVTSAERRGVFVDLRLSRFLQSGEEESQRGWCMVSSFAPPLSLRVGVLVYGVVYLLLICSTVEKFVFYSVFLFWSDQMSFLSNESKNYF